MPMLFMSTVHQLLYLGHYRLQLTWRYFGVMFSFRYITSTGLAKIRMKF